MAGQETLRTHREIEKQSDARKKDLSAVKRLKTDPPGLFGCSLSLKFPAPPLLLLLPKKTRE
jgi:hypothetical protein